ncbi:hypothetical protein JOF35_002685 [Streptomyces demainii]|uniref:Transposase n=1 Tax=Streptomyces demainii TaxID=588122 RepID=A0ABT9KPN9_9ACTN|nr:hypothetical protein [Streptomyces demainii]
MRESPADARHRLRQDEDVSVVKIKLVVKRHT